MTFQARPTTYRGIEMRSRLEAKFAAILDKIGEEMGPAWSWEYEPRAFAGRSGQYLPDFVVYDGPLPSLYIEVKPTYEHALRVMARMQIIWESDPAATLWVDCPEGMFQASPASGRRWVWQSFR